MIKLIMAPPNPSALKDRMHDIIWNQKSCALAGRLARALRQVSVNGKGGLKVDLSPFKPL
jgi:hypothetical protein